MYREGYSFEVGDLEMAVQTTGTKSDAGTPALSHMAIFVTRFTLEPNRFLGKRRCIASQCESQPDP